MEEPQDSRWKRPVRQSERKGRRIAQQGDPGYRGVAEGEGEALTRKAIELAKAGDMQALRLCLDRLVPPRKDNPVAFDLPEMKTLNDAVPAMVPLSSVGRRLNADGGRADKMVQAFAKIIETAELEERVRKLEEVIDK
jgi:hypothetical protein